MADRVWLGCEQCYDDDKTDAPDHEREIGTPPTGSVFISLAENMPLAEAIATITNARGVWDRQVPDERPLWVAADNALLAQVLADHWGTVDEQGNRSALEIRPVPEDAP